MLKNPLFFALLFFGFSFGTGAFAAIDHRNQDDVINAIYDQLANQGYLEGITSAEKSSVIDVIKAEVEDSLARVDHAELSLDTEASNYFLFDTIKNVIQKVSKVVKTIGGRVVKAIGGALGTVVDAGLQFLGKVDTQFIKDVVGVAADALGVLIAGSGETLAAASLAIPVGGEVIAPIVGALAPFATVVFNADNVSAIADVIGMSARTAFKIKDSDLVKGFSEKLNATIEKVDLSPSKVKVDFTKNLGGACHGLMKFLGGLSPKNYDKQPDNVKTSAAHCNHFAGSINHHATAAAQN